MKTLWVSQPDLLRVRENLADPHEVGGHFDVRGTQLVPVISANGNHNSIVVSKQHPFVFHTHPGVCTTKASCALGVPSSQDMRQILAGSTYGNIAHFVFAHEGTYVVQARCQLLERFMKNSAIGDDVKATFKKFQGDFSRSSQAYPSFVRSWISFANSNGFSVHYFPYGSQLSITLENKCF